MQYQERTPTLMANDSSVGTHSWTQVDNAKVDDGEYAELATINSASTLTSNYLKASEFDFNIPDTATILGIEVYFKKWRALVCSDGTVKLIDSSGAYSSDNGAIAGEWPDEPTYVKHGSQGSLWGLTWTPADINSGNFGVVLSARVAGFGLWPGAIDAIRIRVYYEFADLAAEPIPTTYMAKISRNGRYLGMLPGVVDNFKLAEETNTAFSTMQFEVSDTFDHLQDEPQYITAESGAILTTEDGAYITTEGTPDVIGNTNPNALIRNNNDIVMVEVSTNYPSGKVVFDGWITTYRAKSGGGEDKITVMCQSHGTEFDNYLIKSGDSSLASQLTQDIRFTGAYWGAAWAQVITPSTSMALDKVKLKLNISAGTPPEVTVALCQGDPSLDFITVIGGVTSYTLGGSNQVLATTNANTISETSLTVKTFTFATQQNLVAGTSYYLRLFFQQAESPYLGIGASTSLASAPLGRFYFAGLNSNNTSAALATSGTTMAMYVDLITSSGNTTSAYSNQDPTAILRDIMDNYAGQGGQLTYTSATTELTGLTRSYTFRMNTILEGLRKCLDLAPSDFYFYVDPATSVLYFKETSARADHIIVYGKQAQEIEIEASADDVKNSVFFTGGDTGAGTNVFVEVTDEDAIEDNAGRVGLARITDNNVPDTPTATVLAENYKDGNKAEKYHTVIVVNNDKYDTHLYRPGHTLGFQGYSHFINSLVIQIVRVERHPDYAVLTVGSLPARTGAYVEEALRRIRAIETVDNPDAPS